MAKGEDKMAKGIKDRAKNKDERAKGYLSSENGIALVMVLVLSAISLGIMAGLLHMLVAGTQTSGLHKRYKTALEAGKSGFDVTTQVMELRGDPIDTAAFLANFDNPFIRTPAACTGTNMDSIGFTGLEAKFMTPTDSGIPATSWINCDDSLTIDPTVLTTYDFQFDVGAGPTYTIYAKIVDTVEGNTAPSGPWEKDEFPPKTGSPVFKVPFLYTVEIDAQNATNRAERAKLSILYQY